MHDASNSTLHLSLQGGPFHRRCSALVAEIAMEKGWHVRNQYAPGSEGQSPDAIIEKDDYRMEGAKKIRMVSVFYLEVIDSSDQMPKWREKKYRTPNVLSFVVSGKTLDQVAADAERVIP